MGNAMIATDKRLLAQTAGDLMSRAVVLLTEQMPLREAARLLLDNRIGGAPVVDAKGKCVGVLSTVDFLQSAVNRNDLMQATAPPLPVTCSFQSKRCLPNGREVTLCDLPLGACPIQLDQHCANGEKLLICRQPRAVLAEWQVVVLENLPADEVRAHMTADPVTVKADAPIRTLARRMIDAHIHRIIVVDDAQSPIGIVSGTDLLAALAYAEETP